MKTKDFDTDALFEAVAHVISQIDEAATTKLDRPGAEKWTSISFYRNQVFEWTRERYCHNTGCHKHNFPYSVDGVVVAYLRIRKDGLYGEENESEIPANGLFA